MRSADQAWPGILDYYHRIPTSRIADINNNVMTRVLISVVTVTIILLCLVLLVVLLLTGQACQAKLHASIAWPYQHVSMPTDTQNKKTIMWHLAMVKQAAVAPDNGPMNSAAGVQKPLL